jgi:hypothetical protein
MSDSVLFNYIHLKRVIQVIKARQSCAQGIVGITEGSACKLHCSLHARMPPIACHHSTSNRDGSTTTAFVEGESGGGLADFKVKYTRGLGGSAEPFVVQSSSATAEERRGARKFSKFCPKLRAKGLFTAAAKSQLDARERTNMVAG